MTEDQTNTENKVPEAAPAAEAKPSKPRTAPKAAAKTAAPTAKAKAAAPIKSAPALKTAPAAKAAKAAAPAASEKKPAAKAAPAEAPKKAGKLEKVAKAAKPIKVKKPKLIRDSFSMPENEYLGIAVVKKRLAELGAGAKKSEVLRAGVMVLKAMDDATLVATLATVERVKTGRPSKKG